MKRFFLLLLIVLAIVSCSKTNEIETTGIVNDYTGLDGCGMLIDLDAGGTLEPISIPSNVTLIANRKVKIRYVIESRASNCMAGSTAKIISLQYL
jgi:hypothetical protein